MVARKRSNVYVRYVHGTSNATVDNAEFAAAVSAINASTVPIDVYVSGNVYLNGSHSITKSARLVFINGGMLTFFGTASITWGTDTVSYSSGTAISAEANPGRTSFTSPSLSFSPGEFAVLIADNEVTGPHVEHTVGIQQRPETLHRVVGTVSGNTYRLAEPFPDALTTNPRVAKISMISDVVVENLKYTWGDNTAPTVSCILFSQIKTLRLVNPQGAYPVPGGIDFDLCYDVTVEHPDIDPKYSAFTAIEDTNYGYNFIARTCTRMRILYGSVGMCRHGIVTSLGFQKPSTFERYGNSLLCEVIGTQFPNPYGNTAFVPVDNHAEGFGWVFNGLTFDIPSDGAQETAGVFIRSRNATVKNCTFRGAAGSANRASGIWLCGPNGNVYSNDFCNLLFGVQGYDFGGYNSDNSTINRNSFANLLGPGILLSRGSGSRIAQNEFTNCGAGGTYANATLQGCIILDADSSARIYGNSMPAYANKFAIRVIGVGTTDARGNIVSGYDGTTTHVFDTNTAGTALNSSHAIAARNFV